MSKGAVNIQNKKARFEYELLDTFTAGIQLTGTEIKSLRDHKASLAESYCLFIDNELWVRGMHIAEYSHASHYNHDTTRDRKLLLNKKELEKLQGKIKNTGLTITPLRLFINEKGLAKLDIALAKGKKLHDKRDSLKKKDAQREMDRARKWGVKEFRVCGFRVVSFEGNCYKRQHKKVSFLAERSTDQESPGFEFHIARCRFCQI